MYGCNKYGYDGLYMTLPDEAPCTDPHGYGWITVIYFLFIGELHALVHITWVTTYMR